MEMSSLLGLLPSGDTPKTPIRQSVPRESQMVEPVTPQLTHRLSFTHLAELIQLPDGTQHRFYEIECISGNSSVVDGIFDRMLFDGEQLSDLMAPLNLGWRAGTQTELALMADLHPLLTNRAAGGDISGLRAYEQ